MDGSLLAEARSLALVISQRVHLQIPSVLAEDEVFSLRISVTGADSLPVANFPNRIRFADCVGIEGLPADFLLPAGESTARIDGLRAVGPHTALIRAVAETPAQPRVNTGIMSNPAWVFATPPYRIYWGDLHIHTRLSNCHSWRCLDPEWCYLYAGEISLLDFAAAADHLRGIAAEPGRWPRLQEMARKYNLPGRFVSLLGFESSHAQGFGGDNNVYFLDDDAPYFWLEREDMHGTAPKVHLRELWQQMDATGKQYLTIPHHTGRAAKYRSWNEDYHDPVREPLFEIYSSWGSSEKRHSRLPISGGNNDAPSYFVDALKAGARFGVMASSDDHATLPGSVHHFRTEPYRNQSLSGHAHKGLTALRCERLDRPSLFAAMRRRDAYATTHASSLVDFQVSGIPMGREAAADAGLRRQREIRLRLTLHDADAAKVVIMRNGEEWETRKLNGRQLLETVNEVVLTDTEPLDKIARCGGAFHPAPFAVYYARIEDKHGAHQWTSPVWIDLEG